MAFVPLSLLAKGIGQVSKNGHERLDVFLEPEDYYNLESKYRHQLESLRHKAIHTGSIKSLKEIPLHKTFLTRKGALLLFSEELANKASEEEELRLQRAVRKKRVWEDAYRLPNQEDNQKDPEKELQTDALKTCHDLSWAILNYGKKIDYRKKGEELYLRFLHDANAITERKIRPGFSPKRYISTWSRYWNEDMLQKMRQSGMISDKTLYRQNPLLPHLYKYATYNLSANPPPYRVTKNMLLQTGAVPSYEFYRVRGKQAPGPVSNDQIETRSKAPPPSQQDAPLVTQGVIQAVKYHETGEIQEVMYSDLKPQEKQEILAELLIAAHEHQQHIRDTLELVLSSNRPHEGASERPESSAASELMADMHRAIMSLVESPVRQQMKERQRLMREQEEKEKEKQHQLQLKEEKRMLKEEQRRLRKQKREEKKKAELEKKAEMERKAEIMKKAAVKAAEAEITKEIKQEEPKTEETDPKDEDHKKREERRKKRREEREERRRLREEKAMQEEKKKKEGKVDDERPPFRDEQRPQAAVDDGEKPHRHRRHRHKDRKPEEESHEERRHRRKETTQDSTVVNNTAPDHQPRYTGHDEVIEENNGNYVVKQQPRGVTTEIEIEYEEILVMDDRRSSHASSSSDINVALVAAGNNSYVVKTSLEGSVQQKATRSTASSRSSEPKQKLFAAVLPGDDLAPKPNSSFYGGAMPITSNLVKQTLSEKVSILSASHSGSDAVSGKSGSRKSDPTKPPKSDPTKTPLPSIGGPSLGGKSRRSSVSKVSEQVVPQIGIEPATPLHPVQASPHQPTPQPPKQYLTPGNSLSGSQRSKGSSQRSSGGQRSTDGHSSLRSEGSSENQRSLGRSGGGQGSSKGQGSDKGSQYSESDKGSRRESSKRSDGSDNDDSDNSDDGFSKSSRSTEQKSLKHEVASKYSQTTKSKSKPGSIYSDETPSTLSKKKSVEEKVEAPFYGLKGAKGPGSQSSSSILKSTSSKKSKSTRGSLPSAMKRGRHAASIRLPGGKIVPVGGSLARSSDKDVTEESESEAEVDSSSKLSSEALISDAAPKTLLKSGKSILASQVESSTKSERKVSFQPDAVATDTDEDVTAIQESDYVTEEDDEGEDQGWPDVREEEVAVGAKTESSSSASRPVSSRSDMLTAHAQKVAAEVIKKQRPTSGLDEDAKKAAELWNQSLSSEESESEQEEEEEWGVKEVQPAAVTAVKVETIPTVKEKKERLRKISVAKKEREIRPSVTVSTPVTKQPSVTASMTSQSSAPSSVSSVQEEFVAEMQRRASDLGIEAEDLAFETEVIHKLDKSDIKPDDVEVYHDKAAGVHVVRSRRSSASSVLTPSSVENAEQSGSDVTKEETARTKQKLVVDLKIEEKAPPSISRASSISTSVSSHSYQRSVSNSPERRRSSIPVDSSQVVLDYDVTTYEGKLGDPKPEEPTIQSGRPHVGPEKIKVTPDVSKQSGVKTAPAEKEKKSDETKNASKIGEKGSKPKIDHKLPSSVTGGSSVADSGKSGKNAAKNATKAKPAATKGPQRAGKPGVKQAAGKATTELNKREGDTVGEELTEEEKLQRDLAKLTQAQKSKKADGQKRKGKKKAAESIASEKDSSLASKTPEKVSKTPEKPPTKTPETPFRMGQPKEKRTIEEPVHSPEEKAESIASSAKPKKVEKGKKKKDPVTQVQVDQPDKPVVKPEKLPSAKSSVPSKGEEEEEFVTPVPSESPVDDYVFTRKEDTPEPTPEPTPIPPEPQEPPEPPKMDDTKSQISEVTEATEASSQAAAENEAEREAKKAAKAEREAKRAAAAEKRRLDVERKRKEKEEQLRREKEEQEREILMKEELEAERRRREEAAKMRKEDAERAKLREQEEEEMRRRRLEQQQERERRQLEEKRRKIEEIQRKKKEEEERKREEARLRALEEEEKRKEEEELMAQMEESEREQYAERKRIEEEERKVREEERRRREEEEARIMMEELRRQAIEKAKEKAEFEEKLKFVREFFMEANGLENAQNVNRSFIFSYFELMEMLGLDIPIE